MRRHHEFGAYCVPVGAPKDARLFSLKVETLSMGMAKRRFVDAVLLDADRFSVVPFIRVAADGSLIVPEAYANLSEPLVAALLLQVDAWLKSKGAEANLDATLFLSDKNLEEALAASDRNGRALPGLVPYEILFREAERYANLSAYVRGKDVLDLNAGFGYGAQTLSRIAKSITLAPQRSEPLARRLWPQRAIASCDVAVHLDAQGDLREVLQAAREASRSAELLIVSQKGPAAWDAVIDAGGEPVKMRRPGCESLGDLDETLGVFYLRTTSRIFHAPQTDSAPSAATVSPRPLRVLFALRPSSERVFGGDVVQVHETAKALRMRGHDVEVSTLPSLNAEGFDIVHLTNLTCIEESLAQSRSVAGFSGAIAMMPIFTDHADETMWGMFTSLASFLGAEHDEDLTTKLVALERRAISVDNLQPPPARNGMMPNYDAQQRAILENVDFLIANADAEMHRVYRYLDCSIPYQVAPSAANPQTYGEFARTAFEARYGLRDFVLVAGRYEPRKNQLLIFEALRGLGYPVLCIGSNVEQPMAHAVRAYRPAEASYIGFLPERELAGAFAAARVVAIASWDEVVSLTSLNAAISGASLVLTRNSYEHEYFRDDAEYCDPASIESIKSALKRAWEGHERRTHQRRQLAKRVLEEYSWERAAELTEAAYYRMLDDNPRRERRLARTGVKIYSGD